MNKFDEDNIVHGDGCNYKVEEVKQSDPAPTVQDSQLTERNMRIIDIFEHVDKRTAYI